MRITVTFHHDGEDNVVIPNRTINDYFLNKLCNGTFISYQTDIPECGEPANKELLVDSDDEGVDTRALKECLTNYGVANGYQLWYRRNDYQNLMVLCGKKRKAEERMQVGVQSSVKKGKKVVQSPGRKGKGVESTDYRSIQELTKKKFLINVSISQCKRAKQRALFDHEDGQVKGELLTAMGRDGNNQMFPIAWAVVNIENNDNWQWFLACICEDLMLGQGAYLTIISDGHKGLMEVVRTMLPYAEHRQCARHIYANFKKKWNDTITPSIRKQIEHLKITQRYWTVCPCGDNNYEVRKGDESFGVNIEKRICSCNWWTLSGVPCVHTVAAYCFLKTDPALGVSPWYSKRMWQNAYSYFIKPVGGSAMWPNTREDPPLPPVQRKMPGRPRKLRIKHVTERDNVISRSGRQMTCQVCWQKGHNKKTCKNEPQPKPTKEKKKPGRKKAGDAGPSTAAGSATVVDESGPTGVDESGQTVVDESGVEVQRKLPLLLGTLAMHGVQRRSKSERIANKAKAFKFGKDGAGSSADKAWDVDEVLAEP
ncbi:60S ribosomal protein L34 [Tanacetum coccineum]